MVKMIFTLCAFNHNLKRTLTSYSKTVVEDKKIKITNIKNEMKYGNKMNFV